MDCSRCAAYRSISSMAAVNADIAEHVTRHVTALKLSHPETFVYALSIIIIIASELIK